MQGWKWMVLIGLGVLVAYGAWAYVQLPDQPGSGKVSGASASYGAPARGSEPLRIEEAASRAEGSPEPTVTWTARIPFAFETAASSHKPSTIPSSRCDQRPDVTEERSR